jgi:hypothetical protein
MKHGFLPKRSCENSWKDLYMAALFENDKSKLPERILEAQRAIGLARKKLFVSAPSIREVAQERQVLDNALFSLQALASCMALPPGSVSAAPFAARIA